MPSRNNLISFKCMNRRLHAPFHSQVSFSGEQANMLLRFYLGKQDSVRMCLRVFSFIVYRSI